jgi:hypothetical protein
MSKWPSAEIRTWSAGRDKTLLLFLGCFDGRDARGAKNLPPPLLLSEDHYYTGAPVILAHQYNSNCDVIPIPRARVENGEASDQPRKSARVLDAPGAESP